MEYQDFEKKVSRSLHHMGSKLHGIQEDVKGLSDSFMEFRVDITEYLSFSAEKYADHESRISKLEKQSGS